MRLILHSGPWLLAALAVVAAASGAGQHPAEKPRAAPTYYVVAEAKDCEPDPYYVEFRGASNLPPGSLISATVTDFYQYAWKDYSDEVYVPANSQGYFSGRISPKKGMQFRGNLILRVIFATYGSTQPASVLAIVGKKGENLGGVDSHPIGDIMGRSQNPQLFQVSGWYYGLETIARVSCGEKR